jgi:hypothetical protein
VIALALRMDRRLRDLGCALQQLLGVRSLLPGQVGVDRRSKTCRIRARGLHRVGEVPEEIPETVQLLELVAARQGAVTKALGVADLPVYVAWIVSVCFVMATPGPRGDAVFPDRRLARGNRTKNQRVIARNWPSSWGGAVAHGRSSAGA